MSVEIIKLSPERLDEALRLYTKTFGLNTPVYRDGLLERLGTERGIFYVAIDNETQAVVGIKFGYIDGETCIGRGIAVLPEYRRQGIATRLVRQFECDLQAMPTVKTYLFASATAEGIPFHIAAGYQPGGLLQFSDPALREQLDLSGFKINYEGYEEQWRVYQVFIALEQPEANLTYLQHLKCEFPQTNVQFFFEKTRPFA